MKKIFPIILVLGALCACEKDPNAVAKVSPEKKAEIERCIDVICAKVFIDTNGGLIVMGSESYGTSAVSYSYPISQESALKISKNWDYSAPKYYQNNPDGILYNHETDACEVVKKLENFIMLQMAKTVLNSQLDCKKVAYGELDDYVLKCPNRAPFGYIVEKGEKTSKFLSAGKDNIQEYLSDSDSIYINVVEKEKCFRVMIPGSDIKKMYAINVCE